ncbi:uncharacterized protein [Physcomitrium patens]|uniref:uncharacterized protein isoform X5 n=1 Tax=Physcomitrium patens TaxID=3218 RepID=UPI000D155738|nr:uncharacterized protein LOC112292288 isoform X5 [Physcomitrium patens]|eukprot:XP_024396384.1 uncharacterized protein LOC112292288 isoform X5 [Physcomitrella patens]
MLIGTWGLQIPTRVRRKLSRVVAESVVEVVSCDVESERWAVCLRTLCRGSEASKLENEWMSSRVCCRIWCRRPNTMNWLKFSICC